MGIDRPVVNQPYYHALYRVMEVEVLPACAYYGLGVVSYSPLARGVLTGKYQAGAEAPKDTARAAPTGACCRPSSGPETLAAAQKVKAYASSAASSRSTSRSPGCSTTG
jgi:aryl-alcohol dehydrogenase (NADP+)